MQVIFAKRARTFDGWTENVRITCVGGKITNLEAATTAQPSDILVDTLLPSLSNLHSHSFQRAMAGMTEVRAAGKDSFWTWRDLMYRFMEHVTPEQYQAIAALTFMEMQEAGYAAVGEFHYVHNQHGGQKYDNQIELSERVFAAAHHTGIGLTHLPVLYSYGGAGKAELAGGQMRFGNTVDSFCTLVANARTRAADTLPSDACVGIAPHSLRATSPEDLRQVLTIADSNPIHIHISEQPKEVTDIQAWLGARPVEWLLQNAPVSDQWCLIHATHMTSQETQDMARSGAIAGLCPITEANLGDGPFNGVEYLAHGGAFGLGSDSNVRISLTEELRTLEYSQRLRDLGRNVIIPSEGSVGDALYMGAAVGGARAMRRNSGRIEVGALADLVAIDSTAPAMFALRDDQILDGLCFAADDTIVTDLWSAGRHQVKDRKHIHRDAIIATYKTAITDLLASI
ncbi:formimidoylglutamate deiminase [Halocynthiibacter namhaensis]|uniref:formimidoylglutamate deiminase n=1 Tax=Halocynthiibacter namhaensis TaxID=1290553 RepID=UPI000578E5A9|nr:formimidoylglutamate deiminase [Halocynthiibacter namhaensis]